LAAVFLAVLEGGDEILLPDPGYPNYQIALGCMPVKIVHYPVRPENRFIPDADEMEALITPRTKMILVNSPSNPTGAVYPKGILQKIVRLCEIYDLYLLSDECYDELVFEGEHVSPASLCDDGRVISVFSFSKTYAMTGFRLGYVVSSRPIANSLNKVLEGSIACTSSIAQRAGEAALQGPREPLQQMREAYRRRRNLVDARLREYGMWVSTPQGAFYSMADISRSQKNSRIFALELLEKAKVAVAPGTAFGRNANQLIRISLASSENDLQEGLLRIKQFLE
jgi:aspartate/methionine/tyrosine aminotransferase